jgi:hypothetical protein
LAQAILGRGLTSEIFPEVQEMNENIAAVLAESGRTIDEEQTLVVTYT